MSDNTILNSEQIKWTQDHLEHALVLHRAGQFDSALKTYLEILKADPEHADSNHLAGLTLLRVACLPDATIYEWGRLIQGE